MCLVTNYAPVVVAVAVVAVVVVSTNFTRSKSIGSKGKKHSNNTLDNANANAPNDTVIVGHCFCPIIGNTLQKKSTIR